MNIYSTNNIDILRYLGILLFIFLLLYANSFLYAEDDISYIIRESYPQNGDRNVKVKIENFYVKFEVPILIESINSASIILSDKTDKISIKIQIGSFLKQRNDNKSLEKMVKIEMETTSEKKAVSSIYITVDPIYTLLLYGHEYEIIFDGELKDEKGNIINEKPISLTFKTEDALTVKSIVIPNNIINRSPESAFDIEVKLKNNIDYNVIKETKSKNSIIKINEINIFDGFKINSFSPKEIQVEKTEETIIINCQRPQNINQGDNQYNDNIKKCKIRGVINATFDQSWGNTDYFYEEKIRLPFNESKVEFIAKVGKDKNRTDINSDETIQLEMELENEGVANIDSARIENNSIYPKDIIEMAPGYETPKTEKISERKWKITWYFKPKNTGKAEIIVTLKGHDKEKNVLIQCEGYYSFSIWSPSNLTIVELKAPDKISIGQIVNVKMSIKNGDKENIANAKDVHISVYIKDDQAKSLIGERFIDSISGDETKNLGFIYIMEQKYLGQKDIFVEIEYVDKNSGQRKTLENSKPIIIQTTPEITVVLESVDKKLIGIDQMFFVAFKVENKGQAKVKIKPKIEHISLNSSDFIIELVSQSEIELSESSEKIKYKIATKEGKTQSGYYLIKLNSLDINDENGESLSEQYLPDLQSYETVLVDMQRPELIEAICEDIDENGKLNKRDILRLIFNEDISISDQIDINDFIIEPKIGNYPFGKGAKVEIGEYNKRDLKIVLGDNPAIKPTSKYSIKVSQKIFDLAGNHIKDKSVDIKMNIKVTNIDNIPPKFIKTYPNENNKDTNPKPIVWIQVKDEPQGNASGVNIDSIRIYINDQEIVNETDNERYSIIKPKGEFKPDDILELKILLKDLVNLGEYNLKIKINDNNENESEQIINFVIKSPLIEIMTFPNPASLSISPIHIIYKQHTNEPKLFINIYDVAGCLIKRFEVQNPNSTGYEIWDGRIGSGERVSAGVYLCELVVGKFHKYWNIAIYPDIGKAEN